ncbi:MAG: isocitrate lyase/phosphoenolpyruvate mutase family protein [Sphingobium sp.]|nr:isocitrate lyase/phosphoenolpyruvate mutase family protein [Sphingobium sp.]
MVSPTLIVDADTGFGNALTLQRAMRAFETRRAPARCRSRIEGFPKRCGHMAGKTVVPLAESVGRIRAALDARQNMLVIARTDALAVSDGLDAAIDRAENLSGKPGARPSSSSKGHGRWTNWSGSLPASPTACRWSIIWSRAA